MDKSFFEQIGGTYRQEGDYSLPNLTVPESVSAGIWGQRAVFERTQESSLQRLTTQR